MQIAVSVVSGWSRFRETVGLRLRSLVDMAANREALGRPEEAARRGRAGVVKESRGAVLQP